MRACFRLTAISDRLISSGVVGVNGGTGLGFLWSSIDTIVKKQLLTCLTSWVRMFSAMTLTPTSIEEVPVWLIEAKK